MYALRCAQLRGRAGLRPVRLARGPVPGGKKRNRPHPLRRAASPGALHALRRQPDVRGVAVRAMRAACLHAIGACAGPARVFAELHRHRAGDRRPARRVGAMGGRGAVSIVRAAVVRRRGNRPRTRTHAAGADRTDLKGVGVRPGTGECPGVGESVQLRGSLHPSWRLPCIYVRSNRPGAHRWTSTRSFPAQQPP